MRKRKGFTLIELMVVILIIAILVAVVLPALRRHAYSAKWSEGRSQMGSIATALRCYAADKGEDGSYPPSFTELGFESGDLNGVHFVEDNYSIPQASFTAGGDPELTFTVQCDKDTLVPTRVTLDESGRWSEIIP